MKNTLIVLATVPGSSRSPTPLAPKLLGTIGIEETVRRGW